ncbi:C4-dicarboxylate ABC transporter substrate-binding protein [Breoghania sp. L-A4]|nr:C4-dicarboxylate ABC transporter substrate-binding protein [Breoghania sp. L-A4]
MTRRVFGALACATGMALSSAGAFAQANLTAETSSAGNSPHLSITHMADVLSEEGIASLQVQEGQTLTNSIINVAEGKTDVAALPLILRFLLEKGRGPFSKQGENGAKLAANLRALYPYNAGAFGLIAHESSNITKWEDIKGKTVFNGPPRGAALVNARQAIQMAAGFKDGEDYKGYQANWGQLANILVDGSADAFVVPLTFPSERVIIALSAGNVNIVSTPKHIFEGEAFGKLLKAPGNIPIVVKAEDMGYGEGQGVTLISEDGIFRGMGTAFADIVHKDMSTELAKAITAAYIKHIDDLKAKAPYARNIGVGNLDPDASGFCGPLSMKYHPGAVAAWEEAGYTVPDCAK